MRGNTAVTATRKRVRTHTQRCAAVTLVAHGMHGRGQALTARRVPHTSTRALRANTRITCQEARLSHTNAHHALGRLAHRGQQERKHILTSWSLCAHACHGGMHAGGIV